MKILLVDDEQLQLLRLEGAVKSVLPKEEYYVYTNPIKAFEENKNNHIDLAFLDIEMPEINGIQLAKKLKSVNPLVKIIFVTAFSDYALSAYKIHASGYITKPVNESKIKEEIDELENITPLKETNRLQIKCFGNFEIFHNGKPISFKYQKTKELLAYLVDREGALININELNAVLWEEDHKSYLRNLVSDLLKTLKTIDCLDCIIKKRNGYAIDVSKVDCDAYEYKKDNPDAIRMYRGEYMIQYPWATFKN